MVWAFTLAEMALVLLRSVMALQAHREHAPSGRGPWVWPGSRAVVVFVGTPVLCDTVSVPSSAFEKKDT